MKARIPYLVCYIGSFLLTFHLCGLAAGTDVNATEPNTPAEITTGTAEPNAPAETTADSAAVTVNGVDINESDVEAQIKPQLEKLAAQLPPSLVEQYKKQIRQQVLEKMMVELLLDEKLKEAKIAVTDEEVIDQLKAMASQRGLSLEGVKALIEAYGRSFEEWKQQARKGMGYDKFFEAQFAGKVNVTEDDAKKFYSENIKQFETPEQVRASHILIKPDATDPNADPNEVKAAAKAKTQNLLKQIKNGADFAKLAEDNSDCPSSAKGGDLDFFERGKMVPAFEKAAFELEIGRISDIVETEFGCHIIKVTNRRDASVRAFKDAKDEIMKMLTQKKQAELVNEYIESLKAKANIVYPTGKEPLSVPGRP